MRGSGKNQDAFRHNRNQGARPVAEFVSKLLDPVIERRAGMTMDLLASWEDIVGDRHAAHSRPEKLDWPRRAHEEEAFEPATLVIACAGPQAVFLQADSDTIIARVNTYFGFAAVGRLRVVQKSSAETYEESHKEPADLSGDDQRKLRQVLGDVEDDDLREALSRLGKGVFSKGSEPNR